jgi:hypothetical protein
VTRPLADRHLSQLTRIKGLVRNSHDYFKHNYDRYNEYRKFVFESSLDDEEVNLLMTLGKPSLEFNVMEAYISRLLGEFSKQEPDIEVNSNDHGRVDVLTIRIVQEHLKHVLTDNNNHHTRYEVYKDLLSGGFSVLKVLTDYADSMSMDQVIKIERAYDPTLCGFDPITVQSHKGDGRFCFELFPKSKEDFEEEFPDVDVSKLSYTKAFSGFNWSYQNDNSRMVLISDFYEKKKKEETIVKVRDDKMPNGKVMTMKKYRKMVDEWDDITVPPAIIGKPRKTLIETIDRYRLIEDRIIEHEETDYTYLPLVFVDGNSVLIKTQKNGNIHQITRPYVYNAKGAQRLKNYAGNSLANEIENTIQHKVIVAKEALPKEEEFLEAYKNVQKASNYVYNAFYEGDPNQAIPNAIREVQRVPAPPEIAQAFTGTDSLMQNILGSYDASLGINNNQLSGIAIVEGATQSNAAAMPYIVGYLQGLQRAAQIYVNLMPKYFTTPRTIPIIDNDGKRNFVRINQEHGLDMDFDTNPLNVILKAGASFQIQKSRTIQMVKEVMQMSPLFAQFMGEKGLNFILDNMDGKGIEELKDLTQEWLQQYAQEKQQAQQAAQGQQNPQMLKVQIEQQKLQHETEKDNRQFQIDMSKLNLEQEKVMSSLQIARQNAQVQMVKAQTERDVHKADMHFKHRDMGHRHLKEAIETHHKTTKGENHARTDF